MFRTSYLKTRVKLSKKSGGLWFGLAWLIGAALVTQVQGAADHVEIDSEQSFINVEVHVPLQNFRSHLASYNAAVGLGGDGNISDVALTFRFSDLHSGNGVRDAHMMAWLGGVEATGAFILESLTSAADGTEHALGLLEIHGVKQPVKFPVVVERHGRDYTISGEVHFDYRQWELPLLSRVGERVDPQLTVRFKLAGTAQ